jgi:RNA polymerase sigma factor (sigma-70 family)
VDRDEFDVFYEAHYPRLVSAIELLTNDPDVACDAVDEAFTRAWEHLRRGRDIESLQAWTRVVALNVARARFRHRRREHDVSVEAARLGRSPDVRDPAISIDVRRALQMLPTRQREVTVYHYFLDLPISVIAAELEISVGAVKASLHFARQRLAVVLRERGDGSGFSNAV